MAERTAEFVLGLLGGIFGIIAAVIVLVIGGIASVFGVEGGFIIGLGWAAIVLSALGIIGASILKTNVKGAAALMLVSTIGGFMTISFAFILPGVLLILAIIIALARKETHKEAPKEKEHSKPAKKASPSKVIAAVLIAVGIIIVLIYIGAEFIWLSSPAPIDYGFPETSGQADSEPAAVTSTPAQNLKSEYIKNYVKLENVAVGEGYGQFDVPGYTQPKPSVSGTLRNTGDKTLDIVRITIYFLDSGGTRIGEKEYAPVSTYSIMGDDTPLKPNYVRDWGYIVDEAAPTGWDNRVEVIVTDITFGED